MTQWRHMKKEKFLKFNLDNHLIIQRYFLLLLIDEKGKTNKCDLFETGGCIAYLHMIDKPGI